MSYDYAFSLVASGCTLIAMLIIGVAAIATYRQSRRQGIHQPKLSMVLYVIAFDVAIAPLLIHGVVTILRAHGISLTGLESAGWYRNLQTEAVIVFILGFGVGLLYERRVVRRRRDGPGALR